MIHRITSVAPDLDDRVIKPNQARSATNMRFGASSEDNNLSGGILVNGMELIDFNPNIQLPDGSESTSLVIGVKEDYENQYVYYAIYSFVTKTNPNHGILQIDVKTDTIQWVVRGGWLNFSATSNVSMTVIDGLLYWTDNVNEPRMVNINRAINTFNGNPVGDDFYPFGNELNAWCFTQIKRNPQFPLKVQTTDVVYAPENVKTPGYWYTTDLVQGYVNRTWLSPTPLQFSYYYIYDNNEESRLAPWSDSLFYVQNLRIQMPDSELLVYCNPVDKTIVKNIVYVLRIGDEGTVYSFKKWETSKFIFDATTNEGLFFPTMVVQNALNINKTPVPESIYDQRYDSLPILSRTNEVANNILNHANVVSEYSDYGTIGFTAVAARKNNSILYNLNLPPADINTNAFKTFRPDSTYTVGLQLIDEFGRASPVLQPTEVTIPNPIVNAVRSITNEPGTTGWVEYVCYPNGLNPTVFKDDTVYNQYNIAVTITGEAPSWAKYIRLCYTKNNTVNFFNKTVCRIYYWYETGDGNRMFMRVQNNLTSMRQNNNILKNVKIEGEPNRVWTFRGYGVELSGDTPFIYDAAEEQYLKISREYFADNDPVPNTGPNPIYIEYKVYGQSGRLILIQEDFTNIKFYTGYQIGTAQFAGEAFPLWYQIELYTKKKQSETVFYDAWNFDDSSQITVSEYNTASDSVVKFIDGDCYLSYYNKNFNVESVRSYKFSQFVASDGYWYVNVNQRVDGGHTVSGYFYAMNLTNISSEDWQRGLGLLNIARTNNDVTANLSTSILFSNQYVRGTVVNGLNKFNPLNIRQAPAENGPITSLVVTNATQQEPGVMLSVGSLGISSFYYGAIQLTNVDGSSNLATTDQHLASQRPLLGQFGTSNPASITKTPLSTVYWWSDVVNDFIRYTNAGLERLGLTYSFNNKLRQDATGKFVVTAYDQVSDEAILIPKNTRSFIFSERYKSFQGYRELYDTTGQTPERVLGMSIKTYFFLNGFVYVSKIDSEKNKFFDVTAAPQLTLVTNEFPSAVKQWNSIRVFGPKPTTTNLEVGEAEGYFLKTEIQPSWWIQRKGEFNASVRRSTVNGGDGTSGKVMESRILYSTFVFDVAAFEKLNFIEVKSNTAIVQ
jgi:hypothetical protein